MGSAAESGRLLSSVAAVAGGLLLVMMCCSVGVVVGEDSGSLATKCGEEVSKVTACLSYATGKADAPTKDCCQAVTDIRDKDPACLCFFIQQAHNGSAQIKSLGIQESRLLLLPSACAIKNASISECPKLLGIPPTSPDYAIFTNATAPASPAAPTGTSSPETANNSPNGAAIHGPELPAALLIVVAAVFLGAFSTGEPFSTGGLGSMFFGSS